MELIELHTVNPQLYINSWLNNKRLLFLESYHLNAKMLYFLKILTPYFLYEEFGIRINLTLVSEAPRLSFCLKDGIAEIIVAVVHKIHLKACIRYHRSINRHECEIRTKTVSAFPFLNRGTESDVAERRIIIND